MQGRIVWLWVLLTTAALLIVIGAAVLLFVPVSFGWVGYAPEANAASFEFSGMYPLTPERAAGAGCVLFGLLLGAAVLGWVLGRRSALSASIQGSSSQSRE
ncbi:hypothetical protein G3T36_01855 [Diaminobutyricibacter tongyongensis]|uniref:Uncharacterized protein n=1 Tax=Leifsonia tongyongensis TaxID=1268043 RepID=A0A6L9XUB7_9MICO|nr:hypothetical protein [Diaminobutyricibacter tongyongensis]NEN04608.1 hypothetical protein [Diaminobutyricibacter tongyongensis]